MTKKTFIKTLKIIIPILFGVFLIWLTYNKTTPIERADVIKYIKDADYFWVFISITLGVSSHASRAYRWKFTLEPLGYTPKFLNSFMAVMIAYFANLGIPRSGEILRATTLTTYENVPFEKAFGTIVAERIADLLMSVLFIFIALTMQYDMIMEVITLIIDLIYQKLTTNPKLILLTLLITLVVLFTTYKGSQKIKNKFKSFATGLKDGVLSIVTMKKKWAFIGHTFFIWIMYFLMFYVIFFSIPETTNTPISTALVSFVTGSFTMAATNGGLGSFPLVIQETLNLFNISNQSGLAIGWILWSAQTILNIVTGVISFFLLPVYNRTK